MHKSCKNFNNYDFLILQEFIEANLQENIADNRGILAAYYAYMDSVKKHNNKDQCLPGVKYTPKQMFWVSAANAFCTTDDDSTKGDAHSAEKIRINEAFSNSEEFSRDFKCKLGTKMNPEKKCVVRR